MSEQLRLWSIGNEALSEIQRTKLDLESRIEQWVSSDISLIDPSLLIIGRQVATDYGGFIDLLCIDSKANLVVIELKRDLTPREVTAQALDYASWVKDLSIDRINEIANSYLGPSGPLETAFLRRFHEELPEVVNENHSIIIVASDIDPSTERIMNYLSDSYGVGINAVQFQYFKQGNGQELLARLFLIEPDTIESQVRAKGSSKRRKNLTFDEIERLFDQNGVGSLYREFYGKLEGIFSRQTRISQIAFIANIDGSNKVILSLVPPKSSASEGLYYQLYSKRLSEYSRIPIEKIKSCLPPGAEDWSYSPTAGDDYVGYVGYFKNTEQITEFLKLVKKE